MAVKKINGYKILLNHELGQGAYGSVFKGEQDVTRLQCAIKIIDKKKISTDPYLKSALLSEIQIMAKLKSTNIVGFYDVLQSSNNYYIVQELCDGDLEKLLSIQPEKTFSEQKAIQSLIQICNGMLTLIRQGIVHRDLKPANILINKGIMKIGDFGFAKDNIHKRVKNESCVGTPLYMAIELLKGMPYTSKCDIWSLGCIFYELIHGQIPFTAKTEFELVEKIQKGDFDINPKLGELSRDFLTRCLRVHENDRICWDDVYKHPIFNGYFHKYLDENTQFENKYKKVMADLRFKINSDNIDLKKLWKNLGFDQEKELNMEQFQNFLETINPGITEAEEIYFFEKMDENGDGSISLKQLQQELMKYSINLTSKHGDKIPFNMKKINSINQQVENSETVEAKSGKTIKKDEQFQKKVRNCFVRLNKIIENKKLTLYKTFVAYDLNNSGVLNIQEFSKILRKLDNSFTPDQIKSVFYLVDEDESNTIQFDQLNNYYCKVNCIPINLHLPKDYQKNNKNKQNKEVNRKRKTTA